MSREDPVGRPGAVRDRSVEAQDGHTAGWEDVAQAPPEGSQTLKDETLVPSVAWAFPLSLTMKSTDDRNPQAANTKRWWSTT